MLLKPNWLLSSEEDTLSLNETPQIHLIMVLSALLTRRLLSLFLLTPFTKGGGLQQPPPRESNIFVSIWPILVSNQSLASTLHIEERIFKKC